MQPHEFSVVSWNILADRYLSSGLADYSHVDATALAWDRRRERILAELLRVDVDVICLQEVEPGVFDDELRPALERRGYDGFMNENRRENDQPGTCTFWRDARFQLAAYRSQARTLSTLLRSRCGRGAINVVNVHLQGDPRETVARLRQLQGALQMGGEWSHQALLVLGDFNCELCESACSEWLAEGRVLREALDWGNKVPVEAEAVPWHRYALSSAYAQGSQEISHTIQGRTGFAGMIDHIWFSSSALALIRALPVLESMAEREAVLERGLPSTKYPSDHLRIGATLQWEEGDLRDLSTCAPKRAEDALQRKEVLLTARIPDDISELRRMLLTTEGLGLGNRGPITDGRKDGFVNGIAELDGKHPLLHGVELLEPTVWPESMAFANIDSNHSIKCRAIASALVRNMDATIAVRDEIVALLASITFQAAQPTKEDLAQTQWVKKRFPELVAELQPDDRRLAVYCEALIQFSTTAVGMNMKWAAKRVAAEEAAAMEENGDDDFAVSFDDL
mmetsp:Transcript_77690/g.195415  ORF Transcript_77690/g.195415 Transcript_77690/m.195415 type:complete len:509 (-) Transcript_77690:220-1746(-)|eukprot:CAMPEP_0115247624 /NCGR_PEP_ID=MMETSP0270-20121206/41649_1 /TAXON_ID=71861 /ORGANISM="Scrippsiella trochoidea, Strain CCMP3099" /LENGTH=508 /DNA_ID=CAMNT_0002662897 /DNA_START=71 /DNA_END=1597 /DNA_ORIENTATION=+